MLNWPFECVTPDGRKHFNFEHWDVFYKQKNREYPCPEGHTRYCVDLMFPSDRLEDVWIHWSPFGTEDDPLRDGHRINYRDDDWSTIWEAYPNWVRTGGDPVGDQSLRIIIENKHPRPTWGEPVVLMSTAVNLEDDHSTRFVYFRGKYWKTHGPLLLARPRPQMQYQMLNLPPVRLRDIIPRQLAFCRHCDTVNDDHHPHCPRDNEDNIKLWRIGYNAGLEGISNFTDDPHFTFGWEKGIKRRSEKTNSPW
jgi:hypothetical protein